MLDDSVTKEWPLYSLHTHMKHDPDFVMWNYLVKSNCGQGFSEETIRKKYKTYLKKGHNKHITSKYVTFRNKQLHRKINELDMIRTIPLLYDSSHVFDLRSEKYVESIAKNLSSCMPLLNLIAKQLSYKFPSVFKINKVCV